MNISFVLELDWLASIGSSAFQAPLTVKDVVANINARRYLLPYVQREFVWEEDQMLLLWDSLMRKYTIGSFLYWSVAKETMRKYQFYEFIRDFDQRDGFHNPKANVKGQDSVTAILDGQQRFTTLYIGLKGTLATKIPWKRWDNDEAFPKRKLYLNLLAYADNEGGDLDMKYDFKFLEADASKERDGKHHWFEVGKVLDLANISDINRYLKENKLLESQLAIDLLSGLFEVTTQSRLINYYMETSQDLEKVLKIFIRTNSLGTELKYSDILLSIASAQWKNRDAREEIIQLVEELDGIGRGFEFDKDFVMKSCLVLTYLDVKFKVSNFNLENTRKIEKSWEDIENALRGAVKLVSRLGYSSETLSSTNSVIPIAYYLKRIGSPKKFALSEKYRLDRLAIGKWLTRSLIKRTFSGTSDTTLAQVRREIYRGTKKSEAFPYSRLESRFRGTTKSIVFTEDDMKSHLMDEYGGRYTFSVLSLLYPTLEYHNEFHVDHIYPRSFFTRRKLEKLGISEKDWTFYLYNFNQLPNLQLLEGVPNEEKSGQDFKEWLYEQYPKKKEREEYLARNYIPRNIDLAFANFKQVFRQRSKLIESRLSKVLIG